MIYKTLRRNFRFNNTTESHKKQGVNSGTPEEQGFPALVVTPIVLLLLQTW